MAEREIATLRTKRDQLIHLEHDNESSVTPTCRTRTWQGEISNT